MSESENYLWISETTYGVYAYDIRNLSNITWKNSKIHYYDASFTVIRND